MIAHNENGNALDIWTKLRAELPAAVIQQRQGAGGRMLDYIDRPVVWERLDSVVPGEWDFTIVDKGESHNGDEPWAVHGRLQILGVIREDIGTGKDFKDAATDAFKRCAVQFGIGRQLYQKGHAAATSARAQATQPVAPPQRSHAVPSNPEPYAAPDPQSTRAVVLEIPSALGPLATDEPQCPKCAGRMWDNRASKKNPKAPDFKCRDRACDGVIWPPKPGQKPAAAPLMPENVRELARVLDMTDDLPF